MIKKRTQLANMNVKTVFLDFTADASLLLMKKRRT